MIVTFKPGTETQDIQVVEKVLRGKISVIDPLSDSTAIDIPLQKSEDDVLELIQYVKQFPSVESAKPAMEYRPID